MQFNEELFPDTIYKLEIIDKQNNRFAGAAIEMENLMSTKNEDQLISIAISGDSNKTLLQVNIRNAEDSRTEMRNVSTLKELSDVIVEELGMTLSYQSQPV